MTGLPKGRTPQPPRLVQVGLTQKVFATCPASCVSMRLMEGPAEPYLLNAFFFFTENGDFLACQA